MDRKQVIAQLESLLLDRKSFLTDDVDSCEEFIKDIEALEIAIKELKSNNEVAACNSLHSLSITNEDLIKLDNFTLKGVKYYNLFKNTSKGLSELTLKISISSCSVNE